MPPRKKITTPGVSTIPSLSETNKAVKETSQILNLEKLKLQLFQQINDLFDILTKEIRTVEELKKKTQEEFELQKRQKKQEDEEQNFNLQLTQKKKQAEFDEKLDKERKAFAEYQRQKEEELTVEKENLDTKKKEFKDLQTQVEAFPQELEDEIGKTKRQITEELKKDFETEKKLFSQKYESDLVLLKQQINSLQTQIKQLEKENQSLKDEKIGAIEQVKQIAVAVVKGKEKELQPPNSQ